MMIDTANQISIDARVTTLADKLGIERHELWLAIVRQAYVEAWTDVVFAVLGLIMAVLGVVLFFKVIKPYGDKRCSACYEDWPVLAIVGSFSMRRYIGGRCGYAVCKYVLCRADTAQSNLLRIHAFGVLRNVSDEA